MSGAEIKPALDVILDYEPDERGNVTVAAIMPGGQMIALPMNCN